MRGAEGFSALGQWNVTGGTAQEGRVLRSTESKSEECSKSIFGLEDRSFWREKGMGVGE